MDNIIVTKSCSKCKQPKPLNQFGKNKSNKDSLQFYCKSCYNAYHKKYQTTESRAKWLENYLNSKQYKKLSYKREHSKKYVESRKKYQQTPQFKTSVKKYRQSEKGKNQARKYYQRENVKVARSQTSTKQRAKFPKKHKARSMVAYAITSGKLLRPTFFYCECGQPAEQYHHHLGYEPEHWLDVVPICRNCHTAIHNLTATPE